MSNTWQKAFEELRDYVVHNPSIEIKADVIIVPSDVKPEFYRLFNTVRANFIKENFPAELDKSYLLSHQWMGLSHSVIENLKLESIDMHPSTKWFLLEPIDGLMRALYDPMFNVLQDKMDLAAFEKTAVELVENNFNQFYREGYQRWATISLIKALAPDKVLKVVGQDSYNEANLQDSGGGVGVLDGNVPEPVEANNISFEQAPENAFLPAKFIVHSMRLNAFVAFRPDFYEALWAAHSRSDKQEWFSIKTMVQEFGKHNLWPDLALYLAEDQESLALIADYEQIARPDIIVEFREKSSWYKTEGLGMIKRHYNVLKPRLGSFVICCEPVPAAALKKLQPKPAVNEVPAVDASHSHVVSPVSTGQTPPAFEAAVVEPSPNIRLLSVNYDISQLEPIIGAVVQAQAEAKEAKDEVNTS